MHVEVIPTLIDQFRETFEGEVRPGWCWITDGPADTAVLGTIDRLTADEAFAPPVPGARSVAAHVAHLRFALDLTTERLRGENPQADWKPSFDLPDTTATGWESLKKDLRRAYDAVLAAFERNKDLPPQEWVPINLVGLAAMTAHNAYHLGAIRQIARVVRRGR
ncbi:MAG: DinB family protein [Planctomycetota bacterium]|nr:DinB family protein [Planctomycetota bacterium]